MEKYIGITEDRLHHIIGVARKAYDIAHDMGFDEDFCRRMFMVGWIHDVGYEFSEEPSEHSKISKELLYQLINSNGIHDKRSISKKSINAIINHGKCSDNEVDNDIQWKIINMANMLIDSKGNEITPEQRLNEIKESFGEDSKQYNDALEICYKLDIVISKKSKIKM